MSEPLYLLSISLVFGTILLIFGMKYFSAAHQARSRAMGEEAYRDLAAKAVSAQSETATSLIAVKGELSDIKIRMAAVEKILKAVE
jgi:uncharacterized membrane protein